MKMREFFTVSQVNHYIKNIFDNDFLLNEISIEGEISNFKAHSSGHMYFTLKDENSAINAVMFKGNALGLKFMPENGMKVRAFGYISVYEKTGVYQFYAQGMQKSGSGNLYMQFERLKNRLAKAGLFDEKHKREITQFPKCVAIITSPTGAAIRDIIRIAERRNPRVKLAIIPALVQGENAGDDIVRAIKQANEWGRADTLIIGRGGGSIEDLWAFNEEKVARAIFESKIPVISAVGHETDFTIADFIADMRAATPSAAAELAIPEITGINKSVEKNMLRIKREMLAKINRCQLRLAACKSRRFFREPFERIYNNQIYIQKLQGRINKGINSKILIGKTSLMKNAQILEKVSPINILKRGYSLAYDGNGELIRSINRVNLEDEIRVRVEDGFILSRVTGKEEKNG